MKFFGDVKVVEDVKRYGWDTSLPNRYRLKQETETRFDTHFLFLSGTLSRLNSFGMFLYPKPEPVPLDNTSQLRGRWDIDP